MPHQSGGDAWPLPREALSREGRAAVRHRSGSRRDRGRGRALRDRERKAGLRRWDSSPATVTATLSPGGYGMGAAIIVEIVCTFAFLMVILGATDRRAPVGFAGIAIGLALTLIHLISIPIDNTSVNPARSTGPALFAGPAELAQLWVFWVCRSSAAASAGLGLSAAVRRGDQRGTDHRQSRPLAVRRRRA